MSILRERATVIVLFTIVGVVQLYGFFEGIICVEAKSQEFPVKSMNVERVQQLV